MDAIEKARECAKKNVESIFYKGKCAIYEYGEHTDPETHITTHGEQMIQDNIPCNLSFSSQPTTTEGDIAEMTQAVTLHINPQIVIKSGSKITVTQKGITKDYSNSGIPAVYATHQQIALKSFEGWA